MILSSCLPAWLSAIARVNPTSHLAAAARDLMQGTAAGHEVLRVILAAAVLNVVFAPLTARLYRRRT